MNKFLSILGVNGYRNGDVPPEEYIHVNFEDGGLGDHICRMTAIKYLITEYPFIKCTVHCPDYFTEFGKKAIPQVKWIEYSKANNIEASQPIIKAGSNNGITSLRTHLIDHAFMTIIDKQVEEKDKNYINVSPINIEKYNLPKDYVVVTSGYTAKVRQWKTSVINEVIDFILSKGCIPVFLGKRESITGKGRDVLEGNFSDDIKVEKGINLRDNTNLIEAHGIISHSKCIVGLDNGLLHLAGCTDVPIIMGFTTVHPKFRMPIRYNTLGWNVSCITPEKSLNCRYCQSNMNFLYDFDFRKCYYDDYKCVEDQTSLPYIEALEKIL